MEPKQVIPAYQEDWEEVQFGRKGNNVHAANESAKYWGFMYCDEDKKQECFVR